MTVETNRIYNEDCLETMRRMGDNFVDLVITDPPYLLDSTPPGSFKGGSVQKYSTKSYSDITNGFDTGVLLQIERVCKVMNLFMFCSNAQIPALMQFGLDKGYSTTLLVWNKTNSIPFSNGTWRQDAEFVVHMKGTGATLDGNSELKRKVVQYPTNPSEFGHPTEKPKRLISRYVRIGSKKGDVVYDPFMGSGTTARACKDLGRNYIGSEISKEYCDIAERRLGQEVLL